MIHVDFHSLTRPVGIMRMAAAVLTCVTFILVATVGHVPSPYWTWCMFAWCFCCFFTLLIVVLEFTAVASRLPFAWDDFTAAFAVLACLMLLATSVIYPTLFACGSCGRQIGAAVASWLCLGAYAAEVAVTRLRPGGQTSGFLSTPPGLMKMLEAFLACLVFTSLEAGHYGASPQLRWCVAVYSLCFVFAMVVILVTTGKLTLFFPFSFEPVAVACNVVSALMYMTAMVMWPLESFRNNKRPDDCGHHCGWDKLVVVTFMTILNFIVYTMDSIYSVYLVFFANNH
ncbi:myeloid-associated differentiation marker-like [Betta splendens]|uniref:Myeloid-associated differentiation marker-like n=1 Tax=Betta splendens TaxID=158456 RepID=A0A6P7N3U5_BETSP|nr:myeloid-associated differentiation marker-like [Betta splendens]